MMKRSVTFDVSGCASGSSVADKLTKMLEAFKIEETEERFVDWKLYERIETLVKRLKNEHEGVRRKTQKGFMGVSHSDTFTGADFVNCLKENLKVVDTAEATHMATLVLRLGYIFPADGSSSTLQIKDDGTLYRFQSTCNWPSRNWDASEEDYAVYLVKKKMSSKGKAKNGLNEDEMMYFEKLLEIFHLRWNVIKRKAEEQLRATKERKKAERAILKKEEMAFWRVHRPMEGEPDMFDPGPKIFCYKSSKRDMRTLSATQCEVNFLEGVMKLSRIPNSVAINNLVSYCEQYREVDPLTNIKFDSNRWTKDFVPRTTTLTPLRLQKWAVSLDDLLMDRRGLDEFETFLKKEFSEENVRFWVACEELRYAPTSKVKNKVFRIYGDYLAPNARFEINVDSKAMTAVRDGMRTPSRYAFDLAQKQIYTLMSKDSYQRFLKSDQFKSLMEKVGAACMTDPRKSNRLLNAVGLGHLNLARQASLQDLLNIGRHDKHLAPNLRRASDFPGLLAERRGSDYPAIPVERRSSDYPGLLLDRRQNDQIEEQPEQNNNHKPLDKLSPKFPGLLSERRGSDFPGLISERRGSDYPLITIETPKNNNLHSKKSLERSKSLNDITEFDPDETPHEKIMNKQKFKLKLKLTRTFGITPGGSPSGSPPGTPNSSTKLVSILASSRLDRKFKSFPEHKKNGAVRAHDLRKKLVDVKIIQEGTESTDINDWEWKKVSHDFY